MENSDNSIEVEETPQKKSKTPQKNSKTPKKARKRRHMKVETKAMKAIQFFDYADIREEDGVAKQFYICQLCFRECNGSNQTNLASHLYYKHRKVYDENIGEVEEPIEVERLKLLQNCVSIIALGGRPFACLMDYGFQEIVAKQLKKFESAGHMLDLKQNCQPDVHNYLQHAADLVRDKIKDTIKGRPISVQLDMASRLGRSVFGIDVQYIDNSNVIIHNIGMMVLDKTHTAENILESYRMCLQRYDIDRKQVVSISGDNGRNVQKMIRLEQNNTTENTPSKKKVNRQLNFEVAEMYERPQRGKDGMNERNEQRETDTTINEEIEAVLENDEPTDDDAIAMIFEECDINIENNQDDTQQIEIFLEEIIRKIATDHNHHDSFILSGIKCAVHTLQLVVKDSLTALPQAIKNIINLCRRIAKILRLESTKYCIEGTGLTLKKPKLDVETRWSSTYVMVCPFFRYHLISSEVNNKSKPKCLWIVL